MRVHCENTITSCRGRTCGPGALGGTVGFVSCKADWDRAAGLMQMEKAIVAAESLMSDPQTANRLIEDLERTEGRIARLIADGGGMLEILYSALGVPAGEESTIYAGPGGRGACGGACGAALPPAAGRARSGLGAVPRRHPASRAAASRARGGSAPGTRAGGLEPGQSPARSPAADHAAGAAGRGS